MKFTNSFVKGVMLVQMVWLVGCGGAMTAVSNVDSFSSGLDSGNQDPIPSIDPQFEKAEQTTLTAEQAMMDAESAIENLWKDGRIVVDGESQSDEPPVGADDPIYFPGKVQSKSLTGLPEKLEAKLDQLFLKITDPVRSARSKIADARMQIVVVMGQIDPTLPGAAQMRERLQDMLERLDQLDSRISMVFQRLAAKAQGLLDKVNVLISGASLGSNPLLWIAIWELKEVRDVVQNFILKLGQV